MPVALQGQLGCPVPTLQPVHTASSQTSVPQDPQFCWCPTNSLMEMGHPTLNRRPPGDWVMASPRPLSPDPHTLSSQLGPEWPGYWGPKDRICWTLTEGDQGGQRPRWAGCWAHPLLTALTFPSSRMQGLVGTRRRGGERAAGPGVQRPSLRRCQPLPKPPLRMYPASPDVRAQAPVPPGQKAAWQWGAVWPLDRPWWTPAWSPQAFPTVPCRPTSQQSPCVSPCAS